MTQRNIALVTGASGGIGKAIAIRLAREGYDVIVHYNNNLKGAEDTVEQIALAGVSGAFLKQDLLTLDQFETFWNAALGLFGRIDLLVNNAGIAIEDGFEEDGTDVWQRTFDVNFFSVAHLSRIACKYFVGNAIEGSVINISSVLGKVDCGSVDSVVYNSSKAAVNSLTLTMAKMYAPNQIRINGVAPGVVDTDIWREHEKKLMVEFAKENQWLPSMISVEDIADTVCFLADAKSITGQIVHVDAGFSLK